jgi:cobalamin-dependent methionine synthase I
MMLSEDVTAGRAGSNGPEASRTEGLIVMATLPGDREAAGEPWHAALLEGGHRVERIGVRAAPIIASRAADLAPHALVLHVASPLVRMAVQSLVAVLLRRGLRIPLLLGGPGVDAAFAQWVAIPQGGTPYWGGVYYCEDAHEMLEVLRQIILFEPPPPAHVHEAPGTASDDCTTCGGCPLAGSCDSQ